MVKFKPIRTAPNNLSLEVLQFTETVEAGDTAFAWAQSFKKTKVYFLELHYSMTHSTDTHLLNLSLLRLPELTLNSYQGAFIHDLMLRQWSNLRSPGDWPLYSSFPSQLNIHDGEALVLQFQNGTDDSVPVSAELMVYYSGGTLKTLYDY